MGKHRKFPLKDGDVSKETAIGSREISDAAMKRIGLSDQICQSCNATNAEQADRCRKCGDKNLRRRKTKFRD